MVLKATATVALVDIQGKTDGAIVSWGKGQPVRYLLALVWVRSKEQKLILQLFDSTVPFYARVDGN